MRVMIPTGPQTPAVGVQSVGASLLRQNSNLMPSQPPFSSLVSPRTTQFNTNTNNNNNMSLLGNIPNVSSLLGQSFANQRRSAAAVGGEHDTMLSTSSSGVQQSREHFENNSGNQISKNDNSNQHSQGQQLDVMQNFQQQQNFSLLQRQQQITSGFGNMGDLGPVKVEHQIGSGDQNIQSLRNIAVKLEPEQLQTLRSVGAEKMEPQHSGPSLFMQQQQQQILQTHSSQAASAAQLNILQQQQRILQMQQQQQQQQQQILKSLPQQRTQLQSPAVRPQVKPTMYEPGMCARRLTQYMYHQQHRPEDNNIDFWRKFVGDYFAPSAKKRWCVSLYGSGRQTTGVFPQDVWHCEICNRKPGRGFETTVEVLPRLCQIKYASGTQEELLYVDMPREYQNASGQIVLDYAKAIQESVFEQLRVVREGQLRIVFSLDLKICSWEFCARRHEELIPRRLVVPQVNQLVGVAQKYQTAGQNGSSSMSTQDLQNTCNSFVGSARQLAKALEVPLVNDLGYTKRYVRCLQISEVVNSMKDLIDYSRETESGPMESLTNFPRRTFGSSSHNHQKAQLTEEQLTMVQNSNHYDHSSAHATGLQQMAAGNGVASGNNSVNAALSTCTSAVTVDLLHQNAMNFRPENAMNCENSPYTGGGNIVQIPSASSSNSLPSSQANTSPFPSPTLSTSNTTPTSHHSTNMTTANPPANLSIMQQPTTQSHKADPTDSQSSVHQIIQEMMMSSQLNGANTIGNAMKAINGTHPSMNGMLNTNNPLGASELGKTGGTGASSTDASGLRSAMVNNAMALNGRVAMSYVSRDHTGISQLQHQKDLGSQFLGGIEAVNSFNNLRFDWKPSR